jgi:hypothetical protein
MNWIGCERKRSWPILKYYLPGETKKIGKTKWGLLLVLSGFQLDTTRIQLRNVIA